GTLSDEGNPQLVLTSGAVLKPFQLGLQIGPQLSHSGVSWACRLDNYFPQFRVTESGLFRDTSSRATVDSRYLQTDLEACIWGYLWMNDNSTKEFIGKIFIAVVSFKAALGFLLYGERGGDINSDDNWVHGSTIGQTSDEKNPGPPTKHAIDLIRAFDNYLKCNFKSSGSDKLMHKARVGE
ncbi:hypothetical protein FXO38_28617, partial [Capsicum annuum]